MKKVFLLIALFGAGVERGSAQTTFTGPVRIQSTQSPTAALYVQRIEPQQAAVDLFANGSSGKALRFLYPDGAGGQQVGAYFSDTGSWYSRARICVSGVYNQATAPLGSDIQYPTADALMMASWADIDGPTMIIRSNSNTGVTNAPLGTMDGAGRYRFAVFPDGSLRFAPAVSSALSSAGFDAKLYRSGAGQLTVTGNMSATAILDTPVVVTLKNSSGSTVNDGQIVVADPNHDNAFLPALTDLDPKVLGVAKGTIGAGASGQVVIHGRYPVSVTGTVDGGDRIVTAGGSGTGRRTKAGTTAPPGTVVGKAAGSNVNGKVLAIVSVK